MIVIVVIDPTFVKEENCSDHGSRDQNSVILGALQNTPVSFREYDMVDVPAVTHLLF